MRSINAAIIRGGALALVLGGGALALVLGGGALAAPALAAPALGAAPAATPGNPASQTLTFKTRLTNIKRVAIPGQTSRNPVVGDSVVITDQYLAHGKVVGHDIVHCILATRRTSLCVAAVSLPRGQLELQGIGPAGGSGDFTIAVTGGTRAYAHATGTATIRSGRRNTGTETFRLRL